jgi:hypothetical protein
MEYTKETLIKEAIKRLEALEDTLQQAQELISAAYAERRVIRYLPFLSCEKEVKQN